MLMSMTDRRADRVAVLVLLGALVLLPLLAGQTPPDPLWIPGIYDSADDAAPAATSMEGVLLVPVPPGTPRLTPASAALAGGPAAARRDDVARRRSRSPPAP